MIKFLTAASTARYLPTLGIRRLARSPGGPVSVIRDSPARLFSFAHEALGRALETCGVLCTSDRHHRASVFATSLLVQCWYSAGSPCRRAGSFTVHCLQRDSTCMAVVD